MYKNNINMPLSLRPKRKLHVVKLFFGAFMVAVMFIPTTYPFVRFFLLCSLVMLALLSKKGKIHSDALAMYIFSMNIIHSIFSFAIGILHDAPGAIPSLKTALAYPFAYVIVGTFLSSKDFIIWLCKVLLITEFFLCIFDIWHCFAFLAGIPFPSFLDVLDLGFGFNAKGLVFKFASLHTVTHIFMLPFTLTLFFVKSIFPKNRIVFLVILELMVLLLSGRTALQLGTILITFMMFIIVHINFEQRKSKKIFKKLIPIIVLIFIVFAIISYLGFSIYDYTESIIGKIELSFSASSSDQTRQEQITALLAGWKQSPVWGYGLGSYIPNVIRDTENVWAYEMTYHAMLFQQGLLGLLMFWSIPIYSAIRTIKICKNGNLPFEATYPFLAGLFAILLANSIDPYLSKMGCLWMLFFPFSIAAYN